MQEPSHFQKLARQRWPFLVPTLCASAGILVAEFGPWSVTAGAILAGLLLAGFIAALRWQFSNQDRWRTIAFCGFLAATFSVLHLWEGRLSAEARLARWAGPRSVLCEAEGVIVSEPRVFASGDSSFQLALTKLSVDGASTGAHLVCQVRWKGEAPGYGDTVRMRGLLENLTGPRNPGQFDFAAWSRRQGVYSIINVEHPLDASLVRRSPTFGLTSLALKMRHWMAEKLSAEVNDPAASDLILAMVLGDTSDMDSMVQEEFRGTGTYHLFSVSGLHVGILAVLLWYVLNILRLPRPATAAIIIPLVFFYVLMTGLKPASMRSAVMAAVVLAGMMTRRQPILFNNLCAAAFLILLLNTNELFDAGFQLSFTVVAAILVLGSPLAVWMEKPFLPDPFLPRKLLGKIHRWVLDGGRHLSSLLATSIAAWLGSFPLTLGYFHLVSLSALAANLIAIPLSFGIMAVSTLSLGAALISGWAAGIFNQTNWVLAKLLLACVHLCASIPYSYFYVATPGAAPSQVVVFDFGVGGATWIKADSHCWLIDCGPLRGHDSVLVPFLRTHGLREIDGLILTHGDANHIGAAAALMQSARPSLVIDGAWKDQSATRTRLEVALDQAGFAKRLVRGGDSVRVAKDATIRILDPVSKTGRAADDLALVTMVELDGVRILVLSDSGYDAEERLLKLKPEEIRCDILVRGSHRSGSEPSRAFLEATHPAALITTAADYPTSEKLAPEWEQLVNSLGISLFREDQCGAATISIRPRTWQIEGFVNHQIYTHER